MKNELHQYLREISNTVISKEELNCLNEEAGLEITPMGVSGLYPHCEWFSVDYCGFVFNMYVERSELE